MVSEKVHPSVLERRKFKKFGVSASLPPGPDTNSTSFAETVHLKLSFGLKETAEPQAQVDSAKKTSTSITCRICKGNHFSSKCPYKDTHQPLDIIQSTIDQVKKDSTESLGSSSASASATSGKYISPAMRAKMNGSAGVEVGSAFSRRDEYPTIRITNLSEDATESDVRELVKVFGSTTRVFVARDKEQNKCKGFAFVSYTVRESAERALNALNGFGYGNLILKVEWSNKD